MRFKHSVIVIGILTVAVGIYHFANPIFYWTMTVGWHLTNPEVIQFQQVVVHLPLPWWVSSRNSDGLHLAVAPSGELKAGAALHIRRGKVTEEALRKKYRTAPLSVDGGMADFVEYKYGKIADGDAIGVRFEDKTRRKLYEFWTIPSRQILLIIPGVPQEAYPVIFDFINTNLRVA